MKSIQITQKRQQKMKRGQKRKRGGRKRDKKKSNAKIVDLNLIILIIRLKSNGLNSAVKKDKLTEWVKKARLYYILPTRHTL